jgi:hypothetical protein
MKKVINAKVYNTETATKVHEWSNNLSYQDFNAIEETLYLTKKGRYFIEYFGGAATRYATTSGNMSSGSEGIKAITEKEAFDWLQEKEATEAIEKYFGEEIEEA